ncbi:MAG: NHL repeat-containing protein, partial [Terriglobales bacterium]
TLTFTIPGGSAVGAVSVVTQGTANLDFTATGGSCANGSTGMCTVRVQFLPLAAGARFGAVTLTDQSVPPNTLFTVLLNGIGTGPVVAFPPGIMSTIIGGTVATTTVGLNYPNGVGVDAAGNVYVGDTGHDAVRKLSPSGVTTTIAGGNGQGYSGDGGPATSAQLYYPTTIRLDGAVNIYIVDDGNNAVRMINPAGIITTVAGLAPGASVCAAATDVWGDGCPATQATLDFYDSYYGEGGTATDAAGNLYIGDTAHNVIRKVGPDGTISIFAGTGVAGYSGDGGPATSAELNNPDGGAFDGAGNFYFSDLYNNVIRVITPGGTILTVAGTGTYGHTGDGGLATSAELGYPYQVAVDAAGDLYITDSGNFTEGDPHEVIRKITPGGIITSVAGVARTNAAVTYSGDGGPATSATMWGPVDIAVDGAGNLYIADDYNHAIRKVDVSDTPLVSFPSTAIGSSSEQDVTVLNLGNSTSLTFGSFSFTSNFLSGPDTTCSTSNPVVPAASCVLGIELERTTHGDLSGSVVLTDNTLNASAAEQTIILKSQPYVTWETPKPITYGTALGSTQLKANAYYNGVKLAGTLTYLLSSSNYNGVPVGGTSAWGAVLGAGTHILWVVFTPENPAVYNSANAAVALVVNQAGSKITWPKPAAITVGTPLSSIQLDAYDPVPGTFTYYPVAGTAFTTPGVQTLYAHFTPTDTTDYETETKTVEITVKE